MATATATVRYEQAVYGSFPFWDRGYAVLAQSPHCRPEWLTALCAACQRFGERPGGVAEAPSLFAMRLEGRGPWVIVGVSGQGVDDRGRPGALAFHALFLRPRDYRRIDGVPFALAGALRSDWSAAVRTLPTGEWAIEAPADSPPPDAFAVRIAAALARGRRVAIRADAPADALARAVWRALPPRARRRASLATWAFANGNRFDLVALPRLAGVALDASYLDAESLPAGPGPQRPRRRWRLAVGGIAAALAFGALGLATRPAGGPIAPVVVESLPPPDPSPDRDDRLSAEDRRRVAEGLADLADRCGVAAGDVEGDPAALMARLADRLRYRGPLLTPEEMARVPEADRRRIAAWDAHVRRFLPDRPLPADFAARPLRRQLDTLAWSFHLAPPRGPVAEVPDLLADLLAVEGPIRPPSDPTQAAYARFLARLPRR